MSKSKLLKVFHDDYKSISDHQLELMNDSQLITTRNMLKTAMYGSKSDSDSVYVMADFNRLNNRIAERFERCYTFGCVPGRAEISEQSEYITELKAELAACQKELDVLRAENRRLVFELTGVEPEPEAEPQLPFYYPDDDSDDSVLIV